MTTTAGPVCAGIGERTNPHQRTLSVLWASFLLLLSAAAPRAVAQATAPQQLAFSGLRAASVQGLPQGQINAVTIDSSGNIILLLDQKDGVRLLKTDSASNTTLAQAQLGAKGDIGLAMAQDPAGNLYITGTATSGTLTATAGAAFAATSGTGVNSFVAKFDSALHLQFLTFTGGDTMSAAAIAATSDAVFLTGTIYSATLPVTSSGAIQTPAYDSAGNGFVERFSSSGSTLVYATYLSGVGGATALATIAADSSDNAYIAGYTSSSGYPTVAALIPEMLGSTSGFLTKLAPAGDGFLFSTFIPGSGVTSLALDPTANNLLLSGQISFGQFPIAHVQTPLAALPWQSLVRMPLDGSSVLSSTALAPGVQSVVTAANGSAWAAGPLVLPLLPVTPLSTIGDSFAVRVASTGLVDQSARLGGIASSNLANAGAPVTLTSLTADTSGNIILGGAFQPTASSSLLATQTFDLPITDAPTASFPSSVHDAVLPASSCSGSLCAGSAAWLAHLAVPSASTLPAALALSTDDAPNLTLRNLSSTAASNLRITSTTSEADNCGTSLAGGAECSIALGGNNPATVTITADNAPTQTQSISPLSTTPLQPVVFSPKELDFGIASAAGSPIVRTITVTNLTQQSQTFTSALSVAPHTTLPYTFSEQSTDCTLAGSASRTIAPGASCHITVSLQPSSDPANDGPIHALWQIGSHSAQLTAYGQAAALALSASKIDFGTLYPRTPRTSRFLYLSNNSSKTASHTTVTLPTASAFTVADHCPSLLPPQSVCQIQLDYKAPTPPSVDSTLVQLDQGLSVTITGRTTTQPGGSATSTNANLQVSTATIAFPTPVPVTSTSSATQTVTLRNTGASAFSLSLALTGDFTQTSSCGPQLAAGASCSIALTFAPSAPGLRQGLLAITAGAGTTPAYVNLSGTAADILSPATNGAVAFGPEPVGEPLITWYKVSQSFTSFSASITSSATGAPFTAALVEDIGYGHGQPPTSAFATTATGTCYNCWLAVRFDPTVIGPQNATFTLRSISAGNPYALALTGTGVGLTGLIFTPVQQDFGSVTINSSSAPSLFVLTNLSTTQSDLNIAVPSLTGPFTISSAPTGGPACGGALPYTASCYLQITYSPTAQGTQTGTLTLQGGSLTASAALSGYGQPDPGLALTPSSLTFTNIPGATATQQTVTVTNTGTTPIQIGTPTASTTTAGPAAFSATSDCAQLAAGASCTATVTYTPLDNLSQGFLSIPISGTATTYTVPLNSAYTSEDAGLQILPGQVQYGPLATGTLGPSRQFIVNNLTAKPLALNLILPRQFVLSGPPCSGLAPGSSCTFSLSFLPLTNGPITGTIFAIGTPTDGSASVNGLSYLQGYGIGSGSLTFTGDLLPNQPLTFGQVASGQSVTKTVLVTNSSPTFPVTIRRLSTTWPFSAASSCASTLQPLATCTLTVSYSPLNQVAQRASNVPPSTTDTGTLIIESDSAAAPDILDLTGSSSPTTVTSPSNNGPLRTFALSQNSLTFATTQAGNQSTPQTITLSNTGTDTIHISAIQAPPDFTVTSTCADVLAASSCTLTVTFTPQISAQLSPATTRIGAIEILSNAVTAQEFVSLLGNSSPSPLEVSQTSLDFGAVQVGSSTSLDLLLTNTGPTAIAFNTQSATGDYSVAAGSCPLPGQPLPPATSCSLHVTFSPTTTGTRTGTLSISTSASTLPLTVALTGAGIQSRLSITPSSMDFGAVAIGVSSNLNLTLRNTGTAPVTSLTLATTVPFSVSTPCPATLAPATACTAVITFTPTNIGAAAANLTVSSSDPASPVTIPLSGTGITNGSFTLTVDGAAESARTVKSGSRAIYSLALTPVNGFNGTVALTCTPQIPADYSYCSVLPSTITLNGAAQSSTATINTVTDIALAAPDPNALHTRHSFGETALALLFPAMLFSWKARSSRDRAWRRVLPVAWAFFAAIALLTSSGCGGGADPNLRYSSPGVYRYQITASSIGSPVVTQSVTLDLTITR